MLADRLHGGVALPLLRAEKRVHFAEEEIFKIL